MGGARRIVFLFVVFMIGLKTAVPAPPELIVNYQEKKCAYMNPGDECNQCNITPGWVSLGFSNASCPQGYSVVDMRSFECAPLRSQYCCTEGHTGSAGNCSGIYISDSLRSCVFLNTAACVPSEDWAPAKDLCPADYSWNDETCSGASACPLPAFLLGALCICLYNSMPGRAGRGNQDVNR